MENSNLKREKRSANELNQVRTGSDLFQQANEYFESHEYEKAIEYYSLYIQETEAKVKDEYLGSSYNNQEEYKKALEYYLKSLGIETSVDRDNHPDIVRSVEDFFKERMKDFSAKPVESIKDSIEKGGEDFSIASIAKPAEKEIIIKCSIEEMTKAFFKDYVIVWHDPNLKSQENQQYIAKLKWYCEVFTFTEWEKASAYVKGAKAVCHVVTSGTNGELLVKRIFESENVCNIYLFCENEEYHSTWAKDYDKVSCVETDIEAVMYHIEQNLLGWEKEASSLKLNLPTFAPIFNDSDKSEMNHLHRYLKVIPNFKNREQAKNDFLALARGVYSDPINAKLLEEFEKNYNEYNKEQTLKWYTRESFLYKVTNNCLRIATSDSIQYCRLLLQDIEQAIKDQYQTKCKTFNGLLYRGAYLSQEEWTSLKENQDKEIEMHGFLSVSEVRNVALHFVESDPSKKVLITIIVPKGPNEEEQGFAEIHQYSDFPQEKEILFNVRSRFTVLETEDDYVYSGTSRCRHLVLLYGARGFRRFITEQSPAQDVPIPGIEGLSCAHCNVKGFETPERFLFVSIADGQKQDKYYCKVCIDYGIAPFLCIPSMDKMGESHTAKIKGCPLMNSNQNQTPFYGYKCCACQAKKHKSYFVCTDCSGKKWCENCYENETLDCLEAGHSILLETSPFSFWCEKMTGNELNHLKFQNDLVQRGGVAFQQASMYFDSHEYEKAIEYYIQNIKQNEIKSKEAHLDLSISYSNLGIIYNDQGEYNKALESHFKAIEICKSLPGDNNILIASLYNNIGQVYDNQREYKKALEYYLKSLDIEKSVDGDDRPASTANSYNNIGNVYFTQGEFKKALEYYLKSLGLHKSVYGDNHPHVAASYGCIGNIYCLLGEFNKALEYHSQSLDIRKSVYGENHPDIANSYSNIGAAFQNHREYKKALECYLKCLDIQKSIYGDNHIKVAGSYSYIGMIYYKQKEDINALEYFLKSLDIKKSFYGDNHPEAATCYNSIGGVYNNQGEYNKALEYYFRSLNIHKSVYGDNHLSTATSHSNIGGVYQNQREYNKALEYFFRSLEILKSLYEDNHPEIATCYNNVGVVYDEQEEYEKALEYYLKSLEIKKSLFGENHLEVADLEGKIAKVYENQQQHNKGLEHYFKSLDNYKSIDGDHHADIATSYENIGRVYDDQGESKKAIEYYLKSLAIKQSLYGDNHPQMTSLYNNLAIKYDDQGEYKLAIEYYLKSLHVIKFVCGDHHSSVATVSSYIGVIYRKLGEYDKALEFYMNSLDIKRDLYGDNHPEIATIYTKIGEIYDYGQRDCNKAREYYLKSSDIRKSLYEKTHLSIALFADQQGMAYQNQGEYKKAIEYYFESLETKRLIYGDYHPDLTTSSDNIASVYQDEGKYKEALQYYLKSLQIRTLFYGDNHSDIAMTYNNMGVVYKMQEEYKKALECYSKCLDIRKSVYGDDHSETIDTQEKINEIQSIIDQN